MITSPGSTGSRPVTTFISLPSLLIISFSINFVPFLYLLILIRVEPLFLRTESILPLSHNFCNSLILKSVTVTGIVNIFAIASGTAISPNLSVGSGPITDLPL